MRILLLFGVVVSCVTRFDAMASEMCMLSNNKQIPADRTLDHFDDLSWRMFKDIGKEGWGNVIIAPYSVAMFMAELAILSPDKYQKELLPALGFPAWNRTAIVKERNEQDQRLQTSGGSNYQSVNRLFVSSWYTDRSLRMSCVYRICRFEIDDTSAIDNVVETWFKTQSNDNIGFVISPERQLPIVAANTVTYSGKWLYKFNPRETRLRKFWSTPDTPETVPTMHAYGNYFHGDLPGFDARIIRLPFVNNDIEGTDMWIILPNEKNGLDRLTEDLYTLMTCARLWAWMKEDAMHVYLPLLTIERAYDLKSSMKRLGVSSSFFEGSLDTVGPRDLPTVEQFIQGTYINIDENGCSNNSYAKSNQWNYQLPNYWEPELLEPNFNVDRPFVWVIMGYNGAPLLSGVFRDPVSVEDRLPRKVE